MDAETQTALRERLLGLQGTVKQRALRRKQTSEQKAWSDGYDRAMTEALALLPPEPAAVNDGNDACGLPCGDGYACGKLQGHEGLCYGVNLAKPEPAAGQAQEPRTSMINSCDSATDDERKTGVSANLKVHRWSIPVRSGDRCACGERVADAPVVAALAHSPSPDTPVPQSVPAQDGPDDPNDDPLDFRCSLCKALPGEPCRNVATRDGPGKGTVPPHRERISAVNALARRLARKRNRAKAQDGPEPSVETLADEAVRAINHIAGRHIVGPQARLIILDQMRRVRPPASALPPHQDAEALVAQLRGMADCRCGALCFQKAADMVAALARRAPADQGQRDEQLADECMLIAAEIGVSLYTAIHGRAKFLAALQRARETGGEQL